MMHDILPTNGLANKFDGGSRPCPLCPERNETRDHVIQCHNPSRDRWRRQFLNLLRVRCDELQTYPPMRDLLLEGIQSWWTNPIGHLIQANGYPHELRGLIHQQNRIGWRQLFHGRLSNEWSAMQNTHYQVIGNPSQQSKRTGDTWQQHLILFIWDQWYGLWKQRNLEVYGHDRASQLAAELAETRRQLDNVYAQRTMMEPCVQELLLPDATHHSQHSLTTTKNWLAIHSPLFKESVRRVKAKAIQGVRSNFQSTSKNVEHQS
jgi:hypothetical protein